MFVLPLIATALTSPMDISHEAPDPRLNWWRDARFGMFIHWGLYSVPAGEYGGKTSHAEWLMETGQVPVTEYEKYLPQFNPTKFNAEEWAKMAKDAGMKYVVITTKHHEGFALFDSKVSDYTVKATPFKRDIMRELSTAVRGKGLTMGWYHSIMDWHHPDYFPARPWNPRQGGQKSLDKYNEYLRAQVSELLRNYGPIGVMWFDGEWEASWSDKYGKPLYDLCRQLQPNVIVNNRVSNSRAGNMEDADSSGPGDFTTPEQFIPATGLPGVDWETCMTMNDHWGYNSHDTNWKSTTQLVHNLVDVVSKGGNYLLNIGPKADGTFPPEAVARLHEIGEWMHVNGESIYGTTASKFRSLPWGRSTTKGNTLFFQIFDWPKDGKLVVPGLGNDPKSAAWLGGGAATLSRVGDDLVIQAPAQSLNPHATVLKIELSSEPVVFHEPAFVSDGTGFVDSIAVKLDAGSHDLDVRYTLDGTDPTQASPSAKGPVVLKADTTVKAAAFYQGRRVSEVVSQDFLRVTPMPAVDASPKETGLSYREYLGDWDKCPDFESMTASSSGTGVPEPKLVNGIAPEHVGRLYEGYLRVPETGMYKFKLRSDDGAILWIDQDLVVDNDGAHAPQTKSGMVPLAKGLHKVKIVWFNKTGGADLALTWGLQGGPVHPVGLRDLAH